LLDREAASEELNMGLEQPVKGFRTGIIGGVGALALLTLQAGAVAGQETARWPIQSVGLGSHLLQTGVGLQSECETVLLPSRECFRALEESASASVIGTRGAPDHRYEGLLVGAGLGAVGFGLLGAAVCSASSDDTDDCTGVTIKSGLLGAALGGLTGLLIGGAFPKQPIEAPADSTQ
jgi:hypothetical protein